MLAKYETMMWFMDSSQAISSSLPILRIYLRDLSCLTCCLWIGELLSETFIQIFEPESGNLLQNCCVAHNNLLSCVIKKHFSLSADRYLEQFSCEEVHFVLLDKFKPPKCLKINLKDSLSVLSHFSVLIVLDCKNCRQS